MAWHEKTSDDEERLLRLENKATEIRKLLLGALLMAKGIWKDNLEGNHEGLEVVRAIEEAEEDFINSSLTDRSEKLEDLLDIILKRAKGIFLLVEYVSKKQS